MKKKLAEIICKHWNDNFCGHTAATKTKAVLCETRSKRYYAVEIIPDGEGNDGVSFHYVKELSDVARCFGVSPFVYVLDDGIVRARMI